MRTVTNLLFSMTLISALAGCGSPDQSEDLGSASEKLVNPTYTFGIGSGISNSDLKVAMDDFSEVYFGPQYPGNSYIQGTYSERFTRYPEALWSQSSQGTPNVWWLRNGGLFDNEQAWQAWRLNTATELPTCTGPITVPWQVTMDYQVDSEPNFDFLVITSTNDGCTGETSRLVASGQKSGSLSFTLPRNCPSAFVSVSYSKDVSYAVGLDMGRVKNVSFVPQYPPTLCPPH